MARDMNTATVAVVYENAVCGLHRSCRLIINSHHHKISGV
jgi:hypothetical protein